MKLAGLKSVDGAHEESIWAVTWVPAADHRPTALLLTGALDETVHAWRPDDLAAASPPARGHALGVVSLAAHPTGVIAAAVSLDSYIRVSDVDSGASVATLDAPPSKVWGVQFHPKVREKREGEMKLAGLKSVDGAHEESIWAVTWVPAADHRPTALLLTGALDETVRAWRPDDLAAASPPARGHALGVVSLAAHPAGVIAAAVSLDSYIRVFDVDSGASVATLDAPPSEVWGVQFHPKGVALAAAGGGSGSVKLWDTQKWQPIASLPVPRPEGARPDKTGSGKFVLSVAWSPDGKLLACGSMDGTIAVYDAVRMKFLHHLEGHHMPVRSMVFSPVDPHVLFTGCDDSHIHIYDAKEKGLIGAMSGHASWVLSIDVSPDGMAVATGSSDRTVRLWDINARASVQTMSNHSDQVWAVAFRPPGGEGVRAGRLASASDDKSVSLYDYS